LGAEAVSAQVATGTPPFGSFGGGPDVIDLSNLNSHVSIPVLHKGGRGIDFTYDISYDTSVWYPVISGSTTSWQPVNYWGWSPATEPTTGYVSYTTSLNNHYPCFETDYSNWTYRD